MLLLRQPEIEGVAKVPTVERAVEEALLKAGLLLEDMDFHSGTGAPKFDMLRCSRTDKGVHAAFNCIALKLRFHPRYIGQDDFRIEDYENKGQYKHLLNRDQVIGALNEFVDPSIRFFGRIILTRTEVCENRFQSSDVSIISNI